MDEQLKKMLQEKYADRLEKLNTAQAFSNLGDVIAGRGVGSQGQFYQQQRGEAANQTIGEIERENRLALQQQQMEMQKQMLQDRLMQAAQESELSRQYKLEQAQANRELQKQLAANALKQKSEEKAAKQGKQLPISTLEAFGDSQASIKALDESQKSFEANKDIAGPLISVGTKFKKWGEIGDVGQQAKSFDAELQLNAQVIGKYLEGGKMTDSDIVRYKQMLPNLSDSYEVAQKKIQLIKNKIAQKQSSQLNAMKAAGYDVGSLEAPVVGPNPNIPAVSKTKETKVIGGQTYEKIQGGWKKVGQ